MPADLDLVSRLAASERGLATVATTRADGSVQASVVNAGVVGHPVDGCLVVGFVTRGGSVKLRHLRERARTAVVFRSGWRWVTVEGVADLAGPDDPLPGLDPGAVPRLLREVFTAIGGTHDDWHEYDRVMAEQRRAAVLVRPERVYANPDAD
ncbi:MAG: TIGR03618 family F420-dependent PPOX class oxidoreductase [Actinobacteria bacterium]|nr:TIGR03618 family F420-dependent PPOX class oxidoreductase [Actinomycetota bacterium]